MITQALAWDPWQRLDDTPREQRLEWGHAGIAQRWLVVYSQAALARAEATLTNARPRASEAIEKPLLHLPAQRFPTPEAAQAALAAVATGWRDHPGSHLSEHNRSAGQGRPTPPTPRQASAWDLQAQARSDEAALARLKPSNACLVLGSHIDARHLSDPEVLQASNGQSHGAGGLRFLNDPLWFVSAWFVKKPCRIQGLLRVMTLALSVDSVAQRRLRRHVAHHQEPVPNHMNHPTPSPTLRGIFQLLAGLHRVRVTGHAQVHDRSAGLHDVQSRVLRVFGERGCRLYQRSPG